MRDGDRANKNDIAISAFSVATKDLSHDVLPPELCRVYSFSRYDTQHGEYQPFLMVGQPKTFSVCSASRSEFKLQTTAFIHTLRILLRCFCWREKLQRHLSQIRRLCMAKKARKRRAWTPEQVRTLKTLARKKTHAGRIAKTLKRSEGATRQKAFSMGLSLDSRV